MIAPIVNFIYRSGGRHEIPVDVTHVTIAASITVIPEFLFYEHQNIVELICHESVKLIGMEAFYNCRRLRRVVMNGVEEVGEDAFGQCPALENVECNKLEIIGTDAFGSCILSLKGMNLPSARIVEDGAFYDCKKMEAVTFGPLLESIGRWAFKNCPSLEGITIPLKNDLFPSDDTFQKCENLRQVFLVEEGILNDTVAALFFEEWRNEMRRVIDSIKCDLPNAPASGRRYDDVGGEKTTVIRCWIESVLSKIIHYKAQHRGLFNAYAAEPSLLSLDLPDEIVRNNVLSFLELPSHTFHREDNTVVINPNLADLELPRELDGNTTGVDSDRGNVPRNRKRNTSNDNSKHQPPAKKSSSSSRTTSERGPGSLSSISHDSRNENGLSATTCLSSGAAEPEAGEEGSSFTIPDQLASVTYQLATNLVNDLSNTKKMQLDELAELKQQNKELLKEHRAQMKELNYEEELRKLEGESKRLKRKVDSYPLNSRRKLNESKKQWDAKIREAKEENNKLKRQNAELRSTVTAWVLEKIWKATALFRN